MFDQVSSPIIIFAYQPIDRSLSRENLSIRFAQKVSPQSQGKKHSDVLLRSALLTQPYDYCVVAPHSFSPGSWEDWRKITISMQNRPLITMSKGAKIYLDTQSTFPLQTLHPSSSGMANGLFFQDPQFFSHEKCVALSLRSQVPCLFYGPSCIVPITNQLLAIYIYLYLLLFCLTLVVFYRKA